MTIAVPRESEGSESRVALTPEGVRKLAREGRSILIESQAGLAAGYGDEEYREAGADIVSRADALSRGDIVLRVHKPSDADVKALKRGALHISFLDPYNERELVAKLAAAGIDAFSMEMIPRTTRAQKMDALSSQASLAGYVAVIAAAAEIRMAFPMMMTPAGTISPVRVFIIGAGVAGLQAIATAKRLGARVEAYDTRPVVEEQVASLGAKFIKIDLGDTGQTEGGYAKALTEEQLARQRELMQERCVAADVVITTAKLFGRKAPLLIPAATVEKMRPGSVIVDLAVDTGGNVELSRPGETVDHDGVKILGLANFPGRVARHASQMYSNNLVNLLTEFQNTEDGAIDLPVDDEIVASALITREGKLINPAIRAHYESEER